MITIQDITSELLRSHPDAVIVFTETSNGWMLSISTNENCEPYEIRMKINSAFGLCP